MLQNDRLAFDLLDKQSSVFSPDESIVIDSQDLVDPESLHRVQVDHRFRNWQQNSADDSEMSLADF